MVGDDEDLEAVVELELTDARSRARLSRSDRDGERGHAKRGQDQTGAGIERGEKLISACVTQRVF